MPRKRKNVGVVKGPYYGKVLKKAGSKHDISFLRDWMVNLTCLETAALDLIRPFDPFQIIPVLTKCTTPYEKRIFDYFRVTLSSEDQNYRLRNTGRGSEWLVTDESSGAFLGLFVLNDCALPWGPFTEWAGGPVGVNGKGEGHNTHHMVVALSRCIPLYDFGKITGGKMLALAATSTEVLRLHEIEYHLSVCAIIIKALHGKSSQYNRLHPRGIEYRGEVNSGAGFYVMLCRKNGKAHLLEQADDPGARITYSLGDQVQYWKERWLPNRVDLLTNGLVVPDPKAYRLSDMIEKKIQQRREHDLAKEPLAAQ